MAKIKKELLDENKSNAIVKTCLISYNISM